MSLDVSVTEIIEATKEHPVPLYKLILLVAVAALFYAGLNRVPEDLAIPAMCGTIPSYVILVIICAYVDTRGKGK